LIPGVCARLTAAKTVEMLNAIRIENIFFIIYLQAVFITASPSTKTGGYATSLDAAE
jgi:hypothetical protein